MRVRERQYIRPCLSAVDVSFANAYAHGGQLAFSLVIFELYKKCSLLAQG